MKNYRLSSTARRSRRGFSLAELMVVIVIIGLLATLVVPALMDRFGMAATTKVKADLKTLEDALTSFAISNQMTYPDSLQELLDKDIHGRTYLNRDTVPKDPWNNEYLYEPPSGSRSYPLVYSYGKDGAMGGEGDNRDLSNEMMRRDEL